MSKSCENDDAKEDRLLLITSALTARANGHTRAEWLAYESMMPNPELARTGVHIVALVWNGFIHIDPRLE